MKIWALSDLHLSLASDKPMDKFGDHWIAHHDTMAQNWDTCVAEDDIVITPGDFSWAGKPELAQADFAWLSERPGYKVLVKGNHDHWWPRTRTKLAGILPPKTFALKKVGCRINGVGFFGARGGDFAPLIRYGDTRTQEAIDKALDKEFRELTASLDHLQTLEVNGEGDGIARGLRICLFHYPPIPPGRSHSRFSRFIADAGAKFCIYGHLHGKDVGDVRIEGEYDGVSYHCTSCDILDFTPLLIAEIDAEGSIVQ